METMNQKQLDTFASCVKPREQSIAETRAMLIDMYSYFYGLPFDDCDATVDNEELVRFISDDVDHTGIELRELVLAKRDGNVDAIAHMDTVYPGWREW